MEIRVKLMGTLKSRTPTDGKLQLADGATIEHVLTMLDIPPDSVQVFTVNDQLERDRHRALVAGDELGILPPVGGG